MAGHGTGSPLTFGCTKCRQTWERLRRWDRVLSNLPGRLDRVKLTGRSKPRPPGSSRRAYARNLEVAFEYECLDCGHVGWSTHWHLAKRAGTITSDRRPVEGG